jgi:DNA polymerase alpha-associated DNA helicase A
VKPILLPDDSETSNNTEAEVTVDTGGDEDDTQLEEVTEALGQTAVDRRRTELRAPRTLETTLFDRLERIYGPGIKRLLAVQYR